MSDSQPPEHAPKPNPTSDRPPSRPPGSRDSSAHLHAALSASGKAEQSLSTLMRAIRDLSSGVSGAREANLQLVRELEAMSDLLGAANERHLALKNRVTLLEQSLERAHLDAQRERAYILDQQDAFIAAMMEDHEQLIAELRRELETARNRPSQRPTAFPDLPEGGAAAEAELRSELEEAKKSLERVTGERDRARETLLKVQAQRDEAQAALVDIARESGRPAGRSSGGFVVGTLRDAPTLPPPEVAASTPASGAPAGTAASAPNLTKSEDKLPRVLGQPVGSLRPRAPELELTPREVPDRLSQPPEELRGALHTPASAPGGGAAQRSLAPQISDPPSAPNASGRPGGYSLTNSVAPEHVSNAPRVSRVPRG